MAPSKGVKRIRYEDKCCLAYTQFLQAHNVDFIRIASEIPTKSFGVIARLQREGWRAGEPDYFICHPVMPYAGLFVEMKSERNQFPTKNDEQLKILLLRARQGYASFCCRGAEAAILVTEHYLNNGELIHTCKKGVKELVRCYNKVWEDMQIV